MRMKNKQTKTENFLDNSWYFFTLHIICTCIQNIYEKSTACIAQHEVIKISMLNSAEHEIFTAHKMLKCQQLLAF